MRQNLTRCVILQLILGELEADQMFEGRVSNRRADARLGQRVDRRLGFSGLARPSQDLAHVW